MRSEGPAGLARVARASQKSDDLSAWVSALVQRGELETALDACAEAATLVEGQSRGEFLDRAAGICHSLGRADGPARLETAWREAPSLPRLLRWLSAAGPAEISRRVRGARQICPPNALHLQGLLATLDGDPLAAATLLGNAPGLGWSAMEHPGHVVFASLTWLLGQAPAGSLREAATVCLRGRPSEWSLGWPTGQEGEEPAEPVGSEPRVSTPSILSVLVAAQLPAELEPGGRERILAELRRAAEARLAGVTEAKRRRSYGHAALLAGCCTELAGKGQEAMRWFEALGQRYRRFPALQAELTAILARLRRR